MTTFKDHKKQSESLNYGSTPTLGEILHPIQVTDFVAKHWDKSPLLQTRGEPEFYAALFSIDDLDYILHSQPIRSPDVRVLQDGKEIPLSQIVGGDCGRARMSVESILQEYRKGRTVSFVYLHTRWPILSKLCASIAATLSASTQVNAYLTPPNSQGLDTHFDTHDVFVLQIAGTKHWRLYDSAYRCLDPQPAGVTPEPGAVSHEEDIAPGDLLYIPRGFFHDAVTSDQFSLHLTVGVHPVIWGDILVTAVRRLLITDPRLQTALPPGFASQHDIFASSVEMAKQMLPDLVGGIDCMGAMNQAREKIRLESPPDLTGHLMDLNRLQDIDAHTVFYRREAVKFTPVAADGQVSVDFYGKSISFPEYVAEDLSFISHSHSFTYRDLPGPLDVPGRVALVRRLTVEGMLTLRTEK